MAEEFEGRDLSGATFWDVDLHGARLRYVDLTGVRIAGALLHDVDIDGVVDHLVVNGVDVTDYVNERDPWFPLRAMLRPEQPEGMRRAWQALEAAWASTIERARRLDEAGLHRSVGGEWSFVQTLRHLVFATDKWFAVPILGQQAFHALGLPNTGSTDFGWPGLDLGASPSLGEVLAVRAEQAAQLRSHLDGLTAADLTREVEVLENGTTPVRECFFTVFEEVFEHNRYALRDLAALE